MDIATINKINKINTEMNRRILSGFSDSELLKEIILRGNPVKSPSKTTYVSSHKVLTVGIGKDHTATIAICDDSLCELMINEEDWGLLS